MAADRPQGQGKAGQTRNAARPSVAAQPAKPATYVGAPAGATPPRKVGGVPIARPPAGGTQAAAPKPAPAKVAQPAKVAAGASPPRAAPAKAAPEAQAKALAEARGQESVRLFAIGAALHRRGRFADASRAYGRAILFNPEFPDAYANLGVALRAQGKSEAAVACLRRALALRPDGANIHSNLGNALRDLGRLEEAAVALQQALRLAPDAPEILYNFGLVLRDMGRFDTALSCFEAVLKLRPEHADCRYDRALTLLHTGDLARGFAEFESRWKLRRNPPRQFDQPRWNGQAIPGKTLLIHTEPGFSDAIQFARYATLAKKKSGATLALECPAEMARLLGTLAAVDRIAIQGGPLGAFDAHIPIMSLPALMGTTAQNVPANVPYLSPPAVGAVALPNLVPSALKVGIVWAGSPATRADQHRSCPFVHFLDLAQVPGVVLYSLQTGEAAGEARALAAEPLIFEIGPVLADFADLATVLSRLDLVVSVDTAAAHLAGALGKPVWVMVPAAPEWRYLARGETVPWYPAARLFRQDRLGEWRPLIERVAGELRGVAATLRDAI